MCAEIGGDGWAEMGTEVFSTLSAIEFSGVQESEKEAAVGFEPTNKGFAEK